MILGIKTADLVAELVLFDESLKAHDIWHTDRDMAMGLLSRIETLLENNHLTWVQLSGVVAYEGPGSFTSLRIGLTTANSIAFSLGVPIVGMTGNEWLADGVIRLKSGDNDVSVLPEYGAEPRITSPRK